MDVRLFVSTAVLIANLSVGFALTTSCSREISTSPNSAAGSNSLLSFAKKASSFSIVDMSGQPVANAKIMIGPRENVPFPGNVLRTDEKGVLVTPSDWTDSQPVTIEAVGFVRATYFGATPENANFVLRRAVKFQSVELKGSTTGFGQLKTDGFLDVGLVFPAISKGAVSTLNIANLISPEVDHMTVLGQDLTIPSNVTFPDQSENYIFPIRFNKPQYRWYEAETGAYKFLALHGRLPFRQTVDDLRANKSFFEIINTIDFREGSVNSMTLSQPTQSTNLAVNGGAFAKTLSFTAPNYAGGNIVLAAAISQEEGLFYPTDLKNVAAGANVMLATPQTTTPKLILASLRAKNLPTTGPASEFTSSVVLPANSSQAFDFLPQLAAPTLNNQVLNLDSPRAPESVSPVMTFASLNKIELIKNGDIKVERKTPQWDVYSPTWAAQLELPIFPSNEPGTTERLRWEVGFGGVATGETVPGVGPQAVEKLTHLTRSALDL